MQTATSNSIGLNIGPSGRAIARPPGPTFRLIEVDVKDCITKKARPRNAKTNFLF